MSAPKRYPRLLWWGIALLMVGTGPLVLIIIATALGLTDDPNPNPIGLGLLCAVTLWPALIMIVLALVRGRR